MAPVRKAIARKPAARIKPQPKPPVPEFDGSVHGTIEDGGPGKNVLVRSKYVREETGTHETLKIIGADLVEDDDDGGIDPYNTGRFDRSKSWESLRSRK